LKTLDSGPWEPPNRPPSPRKPFEFPLELGWIEIAKVDNGTSVLKSRHCHRYQSLQHSAYNSSTHTALLSTNRAAYFATVIEARLPAALKANIFHENQLLTVRPRFRRK